MKKTLQVALGIVVAYAVIWQMRLYTVRETVKSVTSMAEVSTHQIRDDFARAEEKRRAAAYARNAKAAEEKRQELEAKCFVLTADGRKLTCQ